MVSPLSLSVDVTTPHAAQMRVLQLLPDLSLNNVTRHVLALTQAVTASGGQMVIASAGGRMEPQMRRAGAELINFEPSKSGFFQSHNTLTLLEDVQRLNISILHAHMLEDGLSARALADAADLPLVMTMHDLPSQQGFFGRRAARKHLTGHPIIAVSDHLGARLRKDFRLPKDQVQVVPTGLDVAIYHEEDVTTERTIAMTEAWGVVEDPRDIMLVPQASSDVGWLTWIFKAITDPQMPDLVWALVCDTQDRSVDVTDMLVRAGIADRVRWITQCDDWPAAIKLSNVVINAPRQPEMHCSLALQAQAMGRPVIATNIGAAAEAIQSGQTGWLIPDKDSAALAATVAKAQAVDPLDRKASAMAARNFVATRHSLSAMQQGMLETYTRAIRVKPRLTVTT